MYTRSGAFSLRLNIFIKTRKIHIKLNYMFGDLLATAGVCKTKTKRRKIEFKCTYSSVSDMKDCIQVLQNFYLINIFAYFSLGKKCATERERNGHHTEHEITIFFRALTGQSFFSFETSFSSFFCLLSFFSSFSRVLFFSFDSLISSSFSSSFCF